VSDVTLSSPSPDVPPEPVVAREPSNRWLVLVLVCFAQFMVVLDATIVNVALPAIQRDLAFSVSDLQWVVNGYTLVFGGFLLLGGRAADLLGRKKLFLAGIAVFTVASLINGLATSAGMLVGARALQGLGAALVSPAALSIITTTFPEGPERTKALGVWSGIAAGGGAIGLLLGGVLTTTLSWEWIFFVNVPVGVLAIALSARYVPESLVPGRSGFDLPGAVLVTTGLSLLTFAIVQAADWGFTDAGTLTLGGIALVLLAAFLVWESRSAAPLVRLNIFRLRTLAVSNAAMLFVAAGLFSMFFFGSLYVQQILGFDALGAGFGFLPVALGIGVGAAIAQQLIGRIGIKPVGVLGLSLAAIGLVWLTGISVDGTYAGNVLPQLLCVAVGMGLTFVPITLAATARVAASDAGLASGILNTTQQIGGALGLAILSTIAANRTTDALASGGGPPTPEATAAALVDGWQLAFVVGAGFMIAGLVLLATLLRGRDLALIDTDAPLPVAG